MTLKRDVKRTGRAIARLGLLLARIVIVLASVILAIVLKLLGALLSALEPAKATRPHNRRVPRSSGQRGPSKGLYRVA